MRRASLKSFSSNFGRYNTYNRIHYFNASDPLDFCFEKGLISYEEHKAGMELRKLYMAKHGPPSLPSTFPKQGRYIKSSQSEDEIVFKHKIYNSICQQLTKQHLLNILLDICVYAPPPSFMTSPKTIRAIREFELFLTGISELKYLFRKTYEAN